MIGRPRKAVAASVCGLGLLASPSAADAAVSITVPGPVNLGAAPVGATTYGAQMGTVTATATGAAGILPSFTATVSSSTFVTGGGTAAETFPKGSISYWSGPVTASTGRQTAVPGQPTALLAQSLAVSRTAFASSGRVLSISTSWRPTIVITVPATAVAGTYTGTITHSVA